MTPCSVKVSLKQEESWSAMLDSCGWRTPSPSCSPECRSTGRLQLITRKTWGVNLIANYFWGRLAALEYIWLVIARVNTWRLRHWTWWMPPPPPPPGPSPRLPLLPLCHHLFCLCQKQLGYVWVNLEWHPEANCVMTHITRINEDKIIDWRYLGRHIFWVPETGQCIFAVLY